MSPSYNSSFSTSHGTQNSHHLVDDLEQGQQGQSEDSLLSPYNYTQTLSNSASPSFYIDSTPGDSYSEYSNYQPSELTGDPFFGVNFDDGVHRIDSLPLARILPVEAPLPVRDLDAPAENTTLSDPRGASTYPLSPIYSSLHNTPSPKLASDAVKSAATVVQHELTTELPNPPYRTFDSQTPANPAAVQLTPDHSGSSRSSAEGSELSMMHRQEQSPRISISQWESMHPENQQDYFTQTGHQSVVNSTTNTAGQSPRNIERDDNGLWRSNEDTGQAGLDPETRRDLSNVEMPSLKQQEMQRHLDHTNSEVLDWRSQAGGSSMPDDERSRSSYFPESNHIWDAPNSGHQPQDSDDDDNIAPVDDAASIHENRLVDGQTYYHFKNAQPNDVDLELIYRSRHWSDAPILPHSTSTNYQPGTSSEAITRWNASADTFSLASRAATWGTRRRSEPSLADWDAVADGSFLKKLSLSKSKDDGRHRNSSIFDQGLDRLANFARKRSDSRLKRARSAVNIPEEDFDSAGPRKNSHDTLAPPPYLSSFATKSTPSINTTLAAMAGTMAAVGTGHARSGSFSGHTTSPKSPLDLGGLARSVIKRARSRSELSVHDKPAQTGLADLWRGTGGPPVPALSSAQIEAETRVPETLEQDDDEEDDDELGDEGDLKVDSEEETDPIVPNYEGFKDHVKRLNPDMDPRCKWLVSRIAHQQEIRYKNLLDLRVQHSKKVNGRSCQSGSFCIALGGRATLIDAKGNPRDVERNGLQLVTDFTETFSDNDSNPGEGALTDETFPSGVPKPPTRNLPAEFECQLCFKPKKFQKPSDWTKHVHEDVQPFTCTYDKCKEPKSFKRKADWVRHENERHRHLEWWVCQIEDCRHICYRKDNFLQHLVREHKLPEPKQKTKAAIKKARAVEPAWIMLENCHHETSNRPQDEPCKFCGKTFGTWKKLTVHLAKHMEHISLPILRLVEARVVDADTIISPVDQNITPITPVSQTKIENSPFNMQGISPRDPYNLDRSYASMSYGAPSPSFAQGTYYNVAVSAGPYVQSQRPQDMNYDQSTYSNNFRMRSTGQNGGFNTVDSNNSGHFNQPRNFGSVDSGFSHGTQVKVEQPRGYGSVDAAFSQHGLPNQNYNNFAQNTQNAYSTPQNFSNVHTSPTYPTSNMHNISGAGFDFDPVTVPVGPGYQQVPMSRTDGSVSSYGQSPQNIAPPFYGPQ